MRKYSPIRDPSRHPIFIQNVLYFICSNKDIVVYRVLLRVSEAVQRSLTGQCWCGSSGVRVRRCELCLAVTGPLQPGVARMGGRTVIASVLAAMLGVLMMGVLSPNKAPFRRIDFTPSAVHGTTSFSQITMDVYGRLHTYRPTP
ncbi:hypothetical protein O3P69_011748 [Scylla paramamosain]|uniref:Uncharacterized protein n=1 Tax=Scylla paramamosain TaxID=85552 RepID=A0AAW0SDV2_SCYPA